jgi:hypothetical protein
MKKLIISIVTIFLIFSCNNKKSAKQEQLNVKIPDTISAPIAISDVYSQKNELQPGEIFLTNIPDDSIYWRLEKSGAYLAILDDRAVYHYLNEISFKTKRLGNTAYDKDGNIIRGMKPVFVSEDEFIKKAAKWMDSDEHDK